MESLYTLASAAAALEARDVSSAELTEQYLRTSEALNPTINAYITIAREEALAAAGAADDRRAQGASIGALDGVPIAIKDNILVRGMRATAGSRILDGYLAPYDATVITKLKDAGAVILGKTNMDEFAMGSSTEHSAYGRTKHPSDYDRVPGGSSGGSAAAVAADMCVAALGSDTGGSIRQPAAFTGTVGFKPSYGAVSRYGLMAMASSFDQIGPMTKNVADARALYHVLRGVDAHDQTTRAFDTSSQELSMNGLRIGLPKQAWGEGADEAVRQSVLELAAKAQRAGAQVVEVDIPYTQEALAVYYVVMPCEVSSNMSRYDGIRYGARAAASTLLETYLASRSEGLGEEIQRRILLGTYALSKGYYDAYYRRATIVRDHIRAAYARVFEDVDVLLTPTTPSVAFRAGEKLADPLAMYLEDIFTVSANVAGIPAISLPCGTAHGLPVGAHVSAAYGNDEALLAIAEALEALD